ncbi:unnamed protein product [Auanema sp. JU1783]|nr:unnamed protein product [Auanema sp. JU1783]
MSLNCLTETKVYYYLDDSPTPYSSVLVTSPENVTLGDFKRNFTKKGYQYFCKELDKDIGCEVKKELTEDSCRLRKNANGLFELYLLSIPGHGTLPRPGTLPRRDKEIVASEKERRRRNSTELDGLHYGIEGPSSSHPASSLGTVISRRAGEHLAEVYTSNSEDPYHYDQSSRLSGMSSSLYEPLGMNKGDKIRKRKPRRDRFRKAYVPSTIGSEESSASQELDRILEVKINMKNAPYLGISVVSYEGAILVSEILPDGAVSLDGRIEVGDQIIQINNNSFENLSDTKAVALLREVASAKKPFTLFVAKPHRNNGYDPLATLASETLPLDISLWVKTAVQCSEENKRLQEMGIQDISQTFDEGTLGIIGQESDDEERALYDQRRNGIPHHLREEALRRRDNDQNEHQIFENLSIAIDPMLVVRAMARPDSGLQVKNRKWLKISVPMSFIGQGLVDWLVEHMTDLPDRKTAKQYATMLLDKGYIKHVVRKHKFTEKCYYVFGDCVPIRSGADSTRGSGGTLRPEAPTEVTYLGSPAPPGIRQIRNPLQNIPPPLADQTWPISPITIFDKTKGARRKDCESPVTNDYASMVGGESTTSYGMGIGRG